MASLETDLRARLASQTERFEYLFGSGLLDPRALKLRVYDKAAQYAAQLEDDTEAPQTARDLRFLIDLDDPVDARSPLGIVIGLLATDSVSQLIAANLLGVGLARVKRLLRDGKLCPVPRLGRRDRVTRASVAERLAAQNSRT